MRDLQSWWGWRLLTTTKHEWLWLKYFTHSVIIDVHHFFSLLHPTKIQHHSIERHSISLKRPLSSPLLYCRCYSSLYNLALGIIISLTPRFFRVQRNEEMEENDKKLSSDVDTKKWRVRVSTYEGLSSQNIEEKSHYKVLLLKMLKCKQLHFWFTLWLFFTTFRLF